MKFGGLGKDFGHLGSTVKRGGSGSGGAPSTAGQAVGLLLVLTKAS